MLTTEMLRMTSRDLKNTRIDTFVCIPTTPGSTTEKPHQLGRIFVGWLVHWYHRAQNHGKHILALEMLFNLDASCCTAYWYYQAHNGTTPKLAPEISPMMSGSPKSCGTNFIICRHRYRRVYH